MKTRTVAAVLKSTLFIKIHTFNNQKFLINEIAY